jgi:hypothetical protein
VLNKKLNMKEYDNLKRDIKANMITEISESEVIKDIVGENEKKQKQKDLTLQWYKILLSQFKIMLRN